MRLSESIAVGYTAYVIAIAWTIRIGRRRRAIATGVGFANIAAIWLAAHLTSPRTVFLRDWFPTVQIPIAYWLSGLFYQRPMPRVERWLLQSDRWLFDRLGLRSAVERAPRIALEVLDLAYAAINVLVPAAFLALYVFAPEVDVDRYWSIVLSSELICYAMLPWIQARTPRELGDPLARPARPLLFRRLNTRFLDRLGIQADTIPSGHAAGSLATAIAVTAWMPATGLAILFLAVLIAAGSIIGRYHYAADAALGWLVAVVISMGFLR